MNTWVQAIIIGVLTILLSGAPATAQKPSVQVPITYQGDTEETIARRAQWIDGAKKEKTLEWWGILTPSEAQKVIAAFNQIYPFITVNYWRGRGEEVETKVNAEYAGGRRTVDVVLGGGGETTASPRWRAKGMLEKFTQIIPSLGMFNKEMYSKFHDWVQPGNNAITPQFNTKLVSPAEAPKSWEDLLDPKWRGQIGLTTDTKVWISLALAEGGWGIEKTEAFLRKLKEQQLIWGSGHTAGHALLIAGEFKVHGEGYVYHVLRSQQRNAPVAWSRVNPVAITGPRFSLLKAAPHPHASRLFLEWLFSPPGLVTYEQMTYYGSVYPGSQTRLAQALDGLTLIYRTEDVELQSDALRLGEKFSKILGITQ